MSYTVMNDNGVIQVRASITSSAEMEQFAKALANAELKYLSDPPEPIKSKLEENPNVQ